MKQLFANTFLIFYTLTAYAQDAIVKTNGIQIKAKVTEIGSELIRYKKFDNLNGPLYSINRSEVFKVVFKNGAEELISQVSLQDLVDQYVLDSSHEKIVDIENYRNLMGSGIATEEGRYINSIIKYWNLSQRVRTLDYCELFGMAKEADELVAEFKTHDGNNKATYFLFYACSMASSAYAAGLECMDTPTYTQRYEKKELRAMQIANKAVKCARMAEEIQVGYRVLANQAAYPGVDMDAFREMVELSAKVSRNWNCH